MMQKTLQTWLQPPPPLPALRVTEDSEQELGLERHPLLVVVESGASALWGAVAAQVRVPEPHGPLIQPTGAAAAVGG